jgi:hypothetical protein
LESPWKVLGVVVMLYILVGEQMHIFRLEQNTLCTFSLKIEKYIKQRPMLIEDSLPFAI